MAEDLFRLKSSFKPAGDQPQAISALVDGLKKGKQFQTLLGVTGSGKTFTVANVIQAVQKPTLVIAHNKTLAAQLAQEYKEFFPDNAVHYFVSYYDYYQPEAYMPITDTYIEKEAQINEEIDRLRHASTQALLTRRDVIIVASVSCIYGLGSPEEYEKVNIKIEKGQRLSRGELIRALVSIHFERTNVDLSPGTFRALGNVVEIMPVNEKMVYRIALGSETVEIIQKLDPVTRAARGEIPVFFLFPAKHFITDKEQVKIALTTIKGELKEQLKKFEKEGKHLEAERLKRRTNYDLALIREVGYCNGIENYSRHFLGKLPGEPPDTLLSYFARSSFSQSGRSCFSQELQRRDFLTIIDESHVTIPQLRGMYAGDQSRKETLIEHGFRLPSARDNRPLRFGEFEERVGQVICTSATPGSYELEKSGFSANHASGQRQSAWSQRKSAALVEQVIRPTGLVDPEVVVRPIIGKKETSVGVRLLQPLWESDSYKPYGGQIADFISEAEKVIKKGERAIGTTLTKKMAENLTTFLKEKGIKAEYLHSDIETLERITILSNFRKGSGAGGFDCIIGVNLLREGLDLPEVSLIGIFDADREGFLRSGTSLIQIIGRAARNAAGRVILYADVVTDSMKKAIDETNRRRAIQLSYNKKHGITPRTIIKKIHDITETLHSEHEKAVQSLLSVDTEVLKHTRLDKLLSEKRNQMSSAVKILDFETAALLRDEISALLKMVPERRK